ncbi:uncharacterized protein BBA_01966 [Beauveria bassiana ARSEF 2860]|uniref:F-box domain-containing protein n=1 Tax=Beauveria bassiana (strain ARSEF 2860) TaxID=655819 RepID=J5K4E6_BEAB2|nr:uncharacterized protein BBA_01966 [Beauveria bassiana ARSEF 2860]EJP68931.1 hypothetical protein BBA_01966 [Beauveria bassiana ARSEF 2860]
MFAKKLLNLREKLSSRDSTPSSSGPGEASVASILLRTSLDSILDIIRFLHRRDRALLSLTCSYMRDAVNLVSQPDHAEDKDERTYINYLYCLARDMPYRWVCEPCMKLHDISTKDTPRDTSQIHCRKIQCWLLYSHFVHRAQGYRLGHRHVQLAVKLSRLGNNLLKEHRLYLEAIMAPYVGTAIFRTGPIDAAPRSAKHTVRCKIVDGRFLTLTTFAYSRSRRRGLNMSMIGAVAVCQHQASKTLEGARFVSSGELMTLTCALEIALHFPNFPVLGHCTQCPVDYEVSWKGNSLRVRAWADFGTDEGAKEGSWGAVVRDPRRGRDYDYYYYRRDTPSIYPVGGLVRASYEMAKP